MATNTADFIWFNGEMMPWANAQVHVLTHAMHYGTSVFEGVRCYDTPKGPIVFRHQEHAQRLVNSAKIYRFPIPYSVEEIMAATRETLRANKLTSAYIRPLAFVGNVGLGVCPPNGTELDLIIAAFPWGAYLGEEALENGVDAMISSWNRAAPNTIPTGAKAGGNYLSSLLVGGEARRHGYDEGIALSVDGYLSEGAGENIFVVKDGELLTPPTTSSILPGITRDTIMILAKDLGYTVREANIARESLYLADEIFMTGTAAEIVPVRSVDRISVGSGKRGPITKVIQNAFFGLFNGTTEDKWGWLDYVNPQDKA
ncbi:branched-chain amino acid transaminase [Vibrio rhizosphaerae]|uniref:Branched-chain-amino-acid aminotransferase n=1 Tax=Vibrio rhizosphaerae TaxID=398736 RepID=A0ABU4IQA2_9VIBR|nr:branched-chain amino acid transaminase [Vibrio rhizosphaerae]MDW6091439.1 branched-chain amino acid transaminase [Vibrio rhizosphaerae]